MSLKKRISLPVKRIEPIRLHQVSARKKNFQRIPLEDIDEDKIIFYDIETDHQFASYAKLKTIAWQEGINGEPKMIRSGADRRAFQQKLQAPDVFKVDFNGCNFDRIVLLRHGYRIDWNNFHDLFFVFKTINPRLPSFSLKFINFYFLGDPHFPQGDLEDWMNETGKPMHEAPMPILSAYNKYDVTQTKNIFRLGWDIVIRDEFWNPYMQDLLIGEPLYEMETEGGMYLNRKECSFRLHLLQKEIFTQTNRAIKLTNGEVQNANSSPQLGRYFSEFENLEIELTADDNFRVDKAFLLSIRDRNPLADCAFRIREANAAIKYFENFLHALDDASYVETQRAAWIPIQLSASAARTRRFTSQSLYKLNFQNPSSDADYVNVIPQGQLGWWFDATQIENVVHIYESEDYLRRAAYEADYNWNEYVWLCDITYGVKRSKTEWDDKKHFPSTVVPHWSIYKEKKSVKLGMNFGMGLDKYCKMNGLTRDIGTQLYADVHKACPAIKELQHRVARDIRQYGYVEDAFGYRYSGTEDQAYKVVAYLIQGCGTGALPKAQIRANWETLRGGDKMMPERLRRNQVKCGVMSGTTHDENGGRIDLRMDPERILHLMQKMNFNMSEKFSGKFDDIPLRAKLYLSKTNKKKKIECDINDHEKILTIITGDPCYKCGATGEIEVQDRQRKCSTCKGYGYVNTRKLD